MKGVVLIEVQAACDHSLLLVVLQGTGFACEVPRIDLSIQSRRLSSKVDITARIQPIQACIRGNGMMPCFDKY